ncbi:sulfurtransferase [Paenibacillus thalictri]|uniref:Sulfurtransferase n=1 Tax=Paenibacillus thalictri TaxID=2527873 RepID=A0A4Q9DI26_9BACL|nr:sulfurtransferase [Paenibacillus thalictri]TBL72663.1 sulfurtransferase [Paenibacillus thalictri]
MKHIVDREWLFEHGNDEHVVIADCRFVMGKPSAGQESYTADHIPGAVYFDLDRHLSDPVGEHGGRHPLPDMQAFAEQLGAAGIDNHSTVIVYDDQGGAMASRLWWMLTYLGHQKVFLLDGGYTKWKEAGYPVTDEATTPHSTVYKAQPQTQLLASMEEVKQRIGQVGTVLVDSRENRRYLGLEEPLDKAAGHIPGAKSYFWKDALNEQGDWKSSEALQERFKDLSRDEEIIVYCGSGVTACPNVLALKEAGFNNVRLYAGSWSDWISYSDNPIATGEE